MGFRCFLQVEPKGCVGYGQRGAWYDCKDFGLSHRKNIMTIFPPTSDFCVISRSLFNAHVLILVITSTCTIYKY